MINSITFSQVYAVEVMVVGILLMYVMQKAELDPLYAKDERWLKSLTRISLIVGAFLASASYFTTPYPGMGILLAAAILILSVNAYKLHRRALPPPDKARVSVRWHDRVY